MVDQKLVMAHVYGHSDFFKNNVWFGHTNRKMMDEMANHGNRIRSYMERYGEDEVEKFIDSCLSLENLIDIHSPSIKRRDDDQPLRLHADEDEDDEQPTAKFQSKDYMDAYINPPGVAQGAGQAEGGREGRRPSAASPSSPSGTCCSSSSSTPRSSPGSATCWRSSATRRTTSPRRARPRS